MRNIIALLSRRALGHRRRGLSELLLRLHWSLGHCVVSSRAGSRRGQRRGGAGLQLAGWQGCG